MPRATSAAAQKKNLVRTNLDMADLPNLRAAGIWFWIFVLICHRVVVGRFCGSLDRNKFMWVFGKPFSGNF